MYHIIFDSAVRAHIELKIGNGWTRTTMYCSDAPDLLANTDHIKSSGGARPTSLRISGPDAETFAATATLKCVYDFFGAERMVLGTNYPYGPEEGRLLVKNSLKALDGLQLNQAEREKILGGNAARILRLGR